MFNKVEVILKKRSTGSEDGIHIKDFEPSEEPQLIEETLAQVFVACGIAEYPGKKKDEKKEDAKPNAIKPDETKPNKNKFESK